MAVIYVGLGSNIDAEKNLLIGVDALREHFGELQLSAVYQSKAFGFEGDDFLNLIARLESDHLPEQVCEIIELVHNLAGRNRKSGKWESRPLDIDLLLYNDLVIDARPVRVPRRDVLEYSFVLRPLAELAPDLVHPITGRTMAEHWQEFDSASHPLDVVNINF